MKVKALRGKVLVGNIQKEQSMIGSIIIAPVADDKEPDIRSRWAQIQSIGEGITDIKVGAWVLVENSDIAKGMDLEDDNGEKLTVWNIDYPRGILAKADDLYSKEFPTGCKINPLKGKVIVSDIQRGERKIGQIILPNDEGKTAGVRPRWAQVYALGGDITEIEVGEWILIKHGNWTRGAEMRDKDGEKFTVWGVNWPTGVLAASPEAHETFADESVYQTEKLAR